MKIKSLLTLLAAIALLAPAAVNAHTTNRAASAMDSELQTIVQGIQTKLKAGQNTATDLAPDLASFDKLIAKHAGEKTDATAQIIYMEAMLYQQVLDNSDKAKVLITQLKTDYPATKLGMKADQILAGMDKQVEAKKVQSALAPGATFPDFSVTDLTGKPLSVAAHKGHVVLIDFWATWCGPCRAELPNVIATYQKFHAQGFDIIGVSLDANRPRLESFLKDQVGMTWQQYFDGNGEGTQNWENKLAIKYGVESIPSTILIGQDGKIIGTGFRGEKLASAIAEAIAKK